MWLGLILAGGFLVLWIAIWIAGATYEPETSLKQKPRVRITEYLYILLFFLWPLLDFLWRKLRGLH